MKADFHAICVLLISVVKYFVHVCVYCDNKEGPHKEATINAAISFKNAVNQSVEGVEKLQNWVEIQDIKDSTVKDIFRWEEKSQNATPEQPIDGEEAEENSPEKSSEVLTENLEEGEEVPESWEEERDRLNRIIESLRKDNENQEMLLDSLREEITELKAPPVAPQPPPVWVPSNFSITKTSFKLGSDDREQRGFVVDAVTLLDQIR
jgi:hypothetical protein